MKHLGTMLVAVAFVALLAACTDPNSADNKDAQQTNTQQQTYQNSQPVHQYDYSMPRDVFQQIYDATMKSTNTWTVFMSAYGTPIASCPSVGFPIAGGTQLTNPMKLTDPDLHDSTAFPQAEPNGLFPPATSAQTWVLCVKGGKVAPVYSEPDVITFPWPVHVDNGKIIDDGDPTITVTIHDQASPAPSASPAGSSRP